MPHEMLATSRPLPVGSTDGREMGWWGMMCLIATEASLFAYLLFGYYYFAAQFGRSWLPDRLPDFTLSLPNTGVLIASSITAWWGERAITRGKNGQLIAALAMSILLGVVFVAVQLREWLLKDFSLSSSSYGSFYFVTTGFHMAHVVVGLLMLIGVAWWAITGAFDARRHAPVSIAVIYWHFVDAVWIGVFFSYYVMPRMM